MTAPLSVQTERMLEIVAAAWVAVELRIVVLGVVSILLAGALRRASASTRNLLWRGLLIGSLAVPVAMLISAQREVEVRLNVPARGTEWRFLDAPPVRDTTDAAASTPMSLVSAALGAVWIGGALILLGAQVRSSVVVRGIRRRARPVSASWRPVIDAARAALGFARVVPVLRSTDIDVPVVCGNVRPVVILPALSDEWPAEVCDAVLRHELAHVARGDVAFAGFTRLMCALHWANPFVWVAARRAVLEAERAADDAVLRSGIVASSYSALLLDFASELRPAGTLAFARVSSLEERIRAILNPVQSRRRVRRRAAAAVMASLTAVCGLVGSTRVSAGVPTSAAVSLDAPSPLSAFDTTDPVGALIATMSDESPQVRAAAAASLGTFGDSRARASLTRALTDSNASVRFYAERALRALRRAP